MTDPTLGIDERPRLPRQTDRGIGIVGAGGIVNDAHLPAYRKAGFNVVGIVDTDRMRAEETAAQFSVPRVYDDVAALLADSAVEIVDVAVYPRAQVTVAEQAIASGKHLLCQKPLADEFPDAARIVDLASTAGVKLAVNQQMRWDAGIRVARQLIDRDWLGTPTYGSIRIHVLTDWSRWPWIYAGERLEVMFHSIHYVDSLRFLLGDPDWVFTSGSRSPGETTTAETKTLTVWEYESGLQVLIDVNHGVRQDDRFATFRFEGTEGLIKGTIGLMYDYPTGRPDTLEATSTRHDGGTWIAPRLETMWFPDAFIGPMASLMRAIEDGGEPETSGADNLKTLRCVFAAYRSMAEKRTVRPDEIEA